MQQTILLGLVFVLVCVGYGTCYCPNDWVRYGTSCYLFVEGKLSYFEARDNCSRIGAHLARVDDVKENHFLQQTLLDRHHYDTRHNHVYWLDGNDLAGDRDWKWSNSDNVTFFDWGPNRPDNFSGMRAEFCLCYYGKLNFKMDDLKCTYSWPFICEISDRGVTGVEIIG